MHETEFIDAVLRTPVKVFGLTLRAYSLGHQILLIRQRNPLVILTQDQFAVFSVESQRQAIQNAALVCSRLWKENVLAAPAPPKLTFWRWRMNRLGAARPELVEGAINDFRLYRLAGMTCPPRPSEQARLVLSKDKDEGRYLGGPFMARLYNFISGLPDREIRQFGETAFDFPMGFAAFLYMCHLEQEGSIEIENEKEAAVQREWEEAVAKVPAARRL